MSDVVFSLSFVLGWTLVCLLVGVGLAWFGHRWFYRGHSLASLLQENATLKAVQESERMAQERQLEDIKANRQHSEDSFQALAARALAQNNEQFLSLAKEKLSQGETAAKGELEKREQAVAELVKPLAAGLEKMNTQITALEREREGAYVGLKEQISGLLTQQEALRSETAQLSRALSQPKGSGRWGELQLRRVVELADMQAHCDFEEQVTTSSRGEGTVRPDMIIHLPGDRLIAVDAKAPLEAYRIAVDPARSEEERAGAFRDHARAVQSHQRALGQKRYWQQFDSKSPDLVVMFLPSEALFSAALDENSELIESGLRDGVLMASPTTLIALLRAVHYGWRQETLATSAREISELGSQLYQRLVTLSGHAQKLGMNLNRSVEAFNSFVGTFESRVLVSGRKLSDLHLASAQQSLEEVPQLTEVPRQVVAVSLEEEADVKTSGADMQDS